MIAETLIILNPHAGRGAAARRRPALEQALRQADLSADVILTAVRGDAIGLARHGVEQGYARIVAAGGDGTINEVINGLRAGEEAFGRRAILGVIPLGTGSDFVKSLDGVAPDDLAGNARRLAAGRTRPIDLGRVHIEGGESRYFINALGMGLDAQAAAEALKITRLKGIAVYFAAIFRALASYQAHPMTVEYGEQRIRRRLLFASIANGRCQGGGFWLTPDALIDDGQLDLCLVDNMRIDEIVRHIPKVMKGAHTRLRQVTMGRAARVRVSSEAPLPVAVDGEVLTTNARTITVETLPAAVEILA